MISGSLRLPALAVARSAPCFGGPATAIRYARIRHGDEFRHDRIQHCRRRPDEGTGLLEHDTVSIRKIGGSSSYCRDGGMWFRRPFRFVAPAGPFLVQSDSSEMVFPFVFKQIQRREPFRFARDLL